jgi:hypothetical protein
MNLAMQKKFDFDLFCAFFLWNKQINMVYFVKFDKKDRIKDENTRSLLMIVD